MSGTRATSCDRCGRTIHVNHTRRRPVTVCRDCYQTDREYIRLATQNAHHHSKETAA